MKKFKNIGLSAMVAFTMMFATTVVVAQEKVAASDNVNIEESTQAMVLASTVQKLNTEGALRKTRSPFARIEVMKEPVSIDVKTELSHTAADIQFIKEGQQNIVWYYHGNNTSGQITDINFWKPETDVDAEPHPDCDLGEELPCSLEGPSNPTQFQNQLTTSGVGGIMDDASSLRLWE